MRRVRAAGASVLIVAAMAVPARADASPANVAALQAALKALHLYGGYVDGIRGPLTRRGVIAFQRHRGLAVDGIAGAQTRRALGWRGRPALGSRAMRFGNIGDGFGAPRGGGRRHEGLDFPVPRGTRVGAAGRGTTIYAGYNHGGYGNLVVIQHRLGFTTWYAHLSSIAIWVGEQVVGGTRIGYVGSTGYSTGPHLHFEVRRYDSPIDPVPLLLTAVAARSEGTGTRVRECVRIPRRSPKPPPGSDWIARERLC